MIITKTQLRKIIKEEIENVVKERRLDELFGFGKKKTDPPPASAGAADMMSAIKNNCPEWMKTINIFAKKLNMPLPKGLFGRVRIANSSDEQRVLDLLDAIQRDYPQDWNYMQREASDKCKAAVSGVRGGK